MLISDRHPNTVVVPVHGAKPLPKGTLASIIRIAGAGKKTFFATLK
jgi:predicted RNA binding protein YcfA (HicA-like mRNA interferase family)